MVARAPKEIALSLKLNVVLFLFVAGFAGLTRADQPTCADVVGVWVNHAHATADKDNAHVIASAVHWGEYGSITSWTGTCTQVDNTPTIKTLWHLVRSNTQYDWDHIITNSSTFVPQ